MAERNAITSLFFLLQICHLGLGLLTATIHGLVNGSVLLPSLSPYINPNEIQWMHNNTLIVWYDNGTMQNAVKPKSDKFNLYKEDGSLQIHKLQIEDSGLFSVNILSSLNQTHAEVHLFVYEKVNTHLELLPNTSISDSCTVVVNCSTIPNHWKVAKCNRTTCQEINGGQTDKESNSIRIDISADNLISCESSNPVTSGSISLKGRCPDDHSTDLDNVHRHHHRSRRVAYTAAGCFAALLFFVYLIDRFRCKWPRWSLDR